MLKKLAGGSLISLCCVAQAVPSPAPSPVLQPTVVEAAAQQAGNYRFGPFQGGYDHLARDVRSVRYGAASVAFLSTGNSARAYRSGFGAGERALNWTPAANLLVTAVPEPTNYTLLAFGLGLVLVAARRQRRFLRG